MERWQRKVSLRSIEGPLSSILELYACSLNEEEYSHESFLGKTWLVIGFSRWLHRKRIGMSEVTFSVGQSFLRDRRPCRSGSLDDLGTLFDFKPFYIRTAGGMVSAPRRDSLLLMTHADEGASFDYGDFWEGEELIYTGRGQSGDQKLSGQNRDVAENLRKLWVFEQHGSHTRRFLGRATCADHWWEDAPDKEGKQRKVLKFRLRFGETAPRRNATPQTPRPTHLRSRRFDETAVPGSVTPGVSSTTPEEIAQLNEKAKAGHHAILVALSRWLEANEWTHIEEVPAAIDLWARRKDARVIFEAKTVSAGSELARTRAGLAQLLEYRYFYGTDADHLCLVTDQRISTRKLKFLSALSILCLWYHDGTFTLCGGPSDVLAPRVS